MFRGLFSQLVALAIGIGIILTFIQPAFVEISAAQDEIGVYRAEQAKVAAVNAQLAALTSQINQVPELDKRALETYLPDTKNVDTISIPRDLEFMVDEAGARFNQAVVLPPDGQVSKLKDPEMLAHAIDLSFAGTYNQTKDFFELLEQNNYPLEVHTLDIKPLDQGSFLEVSMTLVTYSYEPLQNN